MKFDYAAFYITCGLTTSQAKRLSKANRKIGKGKARS